MLVSFNGLPQNEYWGETLNWICSLSARVVAQPAWSSTVELYLRKSSKSQRSSVYILFVLEQQYKSTSHCIYWDAKVYCSFAFHVKTPCSVIFEMTSTSGMLIHSYSATSYVLWRQPHYFYKSEESAVAQNRICREQKPSSKAALNTCVCNSRRLGQTMCYFYFDIQQVQTGVVHRDIFFLQNALWNRQGLKTYA